ncbi:MAG: permease [Alphaproteobacteria bacterium]|nr:permease [Alphaproteobacteria bacterium]
MMTEHEKHTLKEELHTLKEEFHHLQEELMEVEDELVEPEFLEHAVPAEARVGRGALALAVTSITSGFFWLFYGALAATLVGTRQAIIGLAAATVPFILLSWPYATWGVRHGLDAALLGRRVFGATGTVLISVLLAASLTYYAVFESSVIAQALETYFGALDIRWWYLIVVVAMLPMMRGSVHTWMGKLNGVLLPAFLVGLVATVVTIGYRTGWSSAWLDSQGVLPPAVLGVPGWFFVAVLYMGAWIQMPMMLEFARLGRVKDMNFHRIVTFGPMFTGFTYFVNGVAGIYIVHASGLNVAGGEAGVVNATLAALGFWGLVFVIATQIKINSLNYYVSSANWQQLAATYLRLDLSRVTWVLITALVVFILMLTDVFTYLQRVVTWQGVFLVGWVGVVTTHFALSRSDRERGPETRPERLPAVTIALGAWVLASLVGIFFAESKASFPVAGGLAPLITLIISVLLYVGIWFGGVRKTGNSK